MQHAWQVAARPYRLAPPPSEMLQVDKSGLVHQHWHHHPLQSVVGSQPALLSPVRPGHCSCCPPIFAKGAPQVLKALRLLGLYPVCINLWYAVAVDVNHDLALVSVSLCSIFIGTVCQFLGKFLWLTVGSCHQIDVVCKAQVAYRPSNGCVMVLKGFSHDVL